MRSIDRWDIEMTIMLKSAYEVFDSKDGTRYLVETLWPEGVDTYFLSPYTWVHELAPSYDMKEMAVWKHWTQNEFQGQYKKALQKPENNAWFDRILNEAQKGPVTLLHNSRKKDWKIRPEDTTAYYLKELFEIELNKYPELSKPPKSPSVSHRDKDRDESQSLEQWSNEGGRS